MPRLSVALASAVSAVFLLASASANTDLPDVCATLDGEPITRNDVLKAFDAVVLSTGGTPSSLTEEKRKEGYKLVVDELISDRLIARAAKGVVVTDAEVERAFQEVRKKYVGDVVFAEVLAKGGMTESGLRENLRSGLRQERWLSTAIEPRVKVTPEEIQKAYDSNKETFTNPPTVRASHILFQIGPGATEAEIAAKKKAAEDVAARLVASKGADFAKLAKELTEDSVTKDKGGDLGWFAAGSAEIDFEKAVFKIKVGDITAPIRTKIGYHLIQKTGERPAQLIPFAEVKERISEILKSEKRKELLDTILKELRGKSKIEIKLPN